MKLAEEFFSLQIAFAERTAGLTGRRGAADAELRVYLFERNTAAEMKWRRI